MKFFEIDEEYLKKGGLISRDKKSGKAYGIVNGRLVAFKNGIKIEPEEIFKGYVADLLANDWQYITYQTKWKPNDRDFYYYITSTGRVACERFSKDSTCDIDKMIFDNVFKTAQEAKNMLIKLQIINKLKALSNCDFGNNYNQVRFSVVYDVCSSTVKPAMNCFSRALPFEVYFETKEDCQKAIDTIGEENLKKYYFDVVE